MKMALTLQSVAAALVLGALAFAANPPAYSGTSVATTADATTNTRLTAGPIETKVKVKIPQVLILQVRTSDNAEALVNFDFTQGQGLTTFKSAMNGSINVHYSNAYSLTNTNLQDVRVLTNGSAAPSVTTVVQDASTASNQSNLTPGDVWVNVHGLSAQAGWQTVALPSDYTVKIGPTTTPGQQTFTITYTATEN